ncbi:MAG: hypothetical protein AMDU5_GPLC00010G0057 [Thermoplasmatales archaeon Gpl]|jgi:hypothetical protein|nr:MAG: hypothetical protein AMDU5_GPLC00010G0057 [Thermoplasmatales archaeon Gpl]
MINSIYIYIVNKIINTMNRKIKIMGVLLFALIMVCMGLYGVSAQVSSQSKGNATINVSFGSNKHIFSSFANTSNWAGYVMMPNQNLGQYGVSGIQGSWTVQKITGTFWGGQAAAQWVGIGGYTTSKVIQTGTVSCDNLFYGTTYKAWYELCNAANPSPPAYLPMSVSPGNVMDAYIHNVGTNSWVINITDISNGQTYQKTVSFVCSGASGEWIEEWPGGSSGLANFGTASFGAYYDCGGIDNLVAMNGQQYTIEQTSYSKINMVSGKTVLASTTPLQPSNVPVPDASYDSFQVIWENGS